VMRALKDQYDFIYLTLERISETQGSVAEQVMPVAIRLLDLAEVCSYPMYEELLACIKEHYQPDILWICNGSMWLTANAPKVRDIFKDVPIVDQQVYDTKEGWIRHYHEPG